MTMNNLILEIILDAFLALTFIILQYYNLIVFLSSSLVWFKCLNSQTKAYYIYKTTKFLTEKNN